MKKIAAATAALAMCVFIFAGCSGGAGTEKAGGTTSPAAAETMGVSIAETERTVLHEETSAEETTVSETVEPVSAAQTEASANEEVTYEFASFDEFSEADYSSFDYSEVKYEDSLTNKFFGTLQGGNGYYLDYESLDGQLKMTMAYDENNISIDTTSDTGERYIIIIKEKTMYMLDPAQSTGYYMAVDESISDEYNAEEMLDGIDIDDDEMSQEEYVNSCGVMIGGEDYTFEGNESGGILFDGDGDLSAIFSADRDEEISAILIHEFSGIVPSGVFDIPEEYELTDLDAMLGSLQQ